MIAPGQNVNTKSKFNPHARRKARRLALQALYQWQVSGHVPADIMAQFLQDQDVAKADINYFEELLKNIVAQQQQLDDSLQPFLTRPVSELDPIELSLLRIGLYELIHRLDVPYRVVINEAVELAKTFGATEGHKYVNAVLDKAAQTIRKIELNR